MDELSDFLVLMAKNPAVRKAVVDLFKNKSFADSITSVVRDSVRGNFRIAIGDDEMFSRLTEAGAGLKPSKNAGGFTGFTASDDKATSAGMFVLPGRFPKEVRQDSLLNSQTIRDALVHEFAHVLPVAKTRRVRDTIKDPRPGSPDQAQSEILRAENALRRLLGLPAKEFYGLFRDK